MTQHAADLLLAAHSGGAAPRWQDVLPASREAAYAVQDATLARLGPIGGWKVGAKGPDVEPVCAPLPVAGLLASGATLAGPRWRMRCVEVEVALRVGRDLDAGTLPDDAFDAVLPVIEAVETRLADWPGSDPLAQLADLQTHGALILGAVSTLRPAQVSLAAVEAVLRFDGQVVAETRGGNPAGDLPRLLRWLAAHCARRGQPLRAGQIVTTGSLTGMLFAPPGAHVAASLPGIGEVELRYG